MTAFVLIAVAVGPEGAASASRSESASGAPKPKIISKPIPFGPARRAETAAYAQRHYGIHTWRLEHPRVIVEHYTASNSLGSTYSAFASDTPDPELGELPGVCAHFVIDRDGKIYQLVRLNTICRHTVGLNWTAFGIEHVGARDSDLMGNPAQLRASLRLTRWLRCRSGIKVRDVIGHNESLTSPYHRENVARLRRQTHADLATPAMRRYRAMLRALPCSG